MPPFFGLVRFDGRPVEDGPLVGLGGTPPVILPGRQVGLLADARIDNRDELLPEFREHGLLAGDSDAALLLAAWLHWGDRCLERLVGDFAFAVWDARSRRLFCGRDPLGMKPLCFARLGSGHYAVASEAQQILLHLPQVSRRLDPVALGEYLAGISQSPQISYFQAIERLPAGHRLTADTAGLRLDRWWEPPAAGSAASASEMECAAHFRGLFERAVTDRLRTSGSVVGVALSGGLDSGSIAAVAQARVATGGPAILGTTFVFDELRGCDERVHVEALTAEIGLEVAWISAEQHWLLSDTDTHPPDLEGPYVGWRAPHRKALERLWARGGRVQLTGHGADSLLCGSPFVYADRLYRGDLGAIRDVLGSAGAEGRGRAVYRYLARPLLPAPADRALRLLAGRRPLRSRLPEWISPELVRRAGLLDRLATLTRPGHLGRRAPAQIRGIALDFAEFDQVVHWHERHARSLGIDVRHPFLDRRLFEYVLSLPPERLFQLGSTKLLLRQAVAGVLPDAVRLRQDKTLFDPFLAFSFEKEAGRIEALLRAPRIADMGLVIADQLREAFKEIRSGLWTRARTFSFAIKLELWLRSHENFFDLDTNMVPCFSVARRRRSIL
jgi:asparagine synthase (glutamine-hydrolysing)